MGSLLRACHVNNFVEHRQRSTIYLFSVLIMLKPSNSALFRMLIKLLILVMLIFSSDRLIAFCLKNGLIRKYGLNSGAKVLCVGHSHTEMGVDAEIISKMIAVPVAKYSTSGADTTVRLAMLRHYFSLHPKSTSVVVYDVASNMFNSTAIGSNAYKLFYPFMGDSVMKDFLWSSAHSREEYFSRYLVAILRYNSPSASGLPSILNEAVYGLLGKKTFFYDRISSKQVDRYVAKKRKESSQGRGLVIIPGARKAFEETIDFITSQGIRLVLVYIPTINLPTDINQDYRQFVEMMKSYTAKNDKVVYLDYKELYGDRYELFCDPEHLNRAGQKLVSEKIAEDLDRLGVLVNKESNNRH